ncbi:MAG: hypothetical protein K8S87_10870 [Planctomycetes bacterium]|nr:hypothetical protein [Planctomycetota bacterium]
MPKKIPKEPVKSKKSDKKKSTDESKTKKEKKTKTKPKAGTKAKSVRKTKSDDKKTKTSTKAKAVKPKASTKKDKVAKEKPVKPKTSTRAKTIKKEEPAKKTKSIRAKTTAKAASESKKTAAIKEKESKKVKKVKSKKNVPVKLEDKTDNRNVSDIKLPEPKKKEKKKKVKELRENLIQVLDAYDKAAIKINGGKNLPKLDKGIPFDDKKHGEICELAARELAQEPRSYKEYLLVMMLPGVIWDEIEKAEVDLSITKLKELAKAYNKKEIDDKKVVEIFKEIIEKNLTTAAVKEKIKSA